MTFTADLVINKQNNRVVGFDKSISDLHCVSTAKYPASVMMLGVVASNGEKMPPIWFDIGYRLTSCCLQGYLGLKNPPLGEKSD